jgi:hypothetical protein
MFLLYRLWDLLRYSNYGIEFKILQPEAGRFAYSAILKQESRKLPLISTGHDRRLSDCMNQQLTLSRLMGSVG